MNSSLEAGLFPQVGKDWSLKSVFIILAMTLDHSRMIKPHPQA